MLDIGWIFALGDGREGFKKLIVSLKDCPYPSIFSTDLVISLTKIFDERYREALIVRCFIPYLVYFLSSIIFFTSFTSNGINNDIDGEKTLAYFLGFMIIILDIYFLYFEFVIIQRDGIKEYFSSGFFNYLDMITSVLNVLLVVETFTETGNA